MALYLRNLFGGQSSTTPGHGKAKSQSIPTPTPHYGYTPLGITPTSVSGTSPSKAQRADSYNTTSAIVPSPLRYPTYDSRSSPDGSRPTINWSPSYKPPADAHISGCLSLAGSASNPRHSNRTLSASADGPEPSPTRSQALAPRFRTHPLLSFTRLHHAPISYDIAFTPSARTVVDRKIHAPVPAVTLAQPATEPPIPACSRLVLRSPKLPWTVAVGPIGSPPSFFMSFFIGNSDGQRKATSSVALTNLDVLYAVHTTLVTRVTPEEWAALGEGSKAQRRVAEAYKQRCTRMGGGWEEGTRRVDWLGSKTHLVGVEIDKSNEAGENVGRLVFGKA
ncbi:hypothetical protein V8E53_004336 [Lactarius tabidus]